MARTLLLTLAVTINHLEGEELERSREGSDDDQYPAGDDSDLDETSPGEIGDIIADMLPSFNDEMWAGSGVFASVDRAEVRTADWLTA